jgi:hypothetical protein
MLISFGIAMLRQSVDRKRANGPAVALTTVLSEAKQGPILDEHTAGWPRSSLVVDDNGARLVFA